MNKNIWLTGITILLVVGMVFLLPGVFSVQAAPPSNDDFNSPTVITSLPYQDTFDTTQATVAADDPNPTCFRWRSYTVWYAFTPSIDTAIQVSMSGEGDPGSGAPWVFFGVFTVFRGNLTQIACGSDFSGNTPQASFRVSAGTTYYFELSTHADDPWGPPGGSIGTFSIIELPPPPPGPVNDDFAHATIITNLPFNDDLDTTYATTETFEPNPSCGGSLSNTVWYTFKPVTGGEYTVSLGNVPQSYSVLAVYTGTSFADLTELHCNQGWTGNLITLYLDAGTTYYFQSYLEFTYSWGFSFQFDVTPPPIADFWYEPGDPNIYDNIQFINSSSDPGGLDFQTMIWDFGDGTTSTDWYPTHRFPADGDYTVKLTVTTMDGRTASITKTVSVRTHDVSITKFKVPESAKAGKTEKISVSIENTGYPDTVQVDLYRSTPGGFDLVGSLTKVVPVQKGNKTTDFDFSYIFTTDDASYGEVTFRAVATITTARDAMPFDNEVIQFRTIVKNK